ncbi:MAG: type IV toxin-antitoxin system AbiEi family antitoxin domain-containing protein [Peptostreptococcaceae bacterium]|nr:type IV toxin-antitoxin system AbiEi family antitoxin domain-containing protein [Peptostreptococcaceae bacterium]
MTYAEEILKIASDNNGIVTTAQITHAGIHRHHLSLLVDKGLLERSERGVYILPTVFDDEMLNLQTRFKRGIFSHETALFLLDLSDRTPIKYSMTFPHQYNTTTIDSSKVKYYRVKDEFYEIGIISIPSPNGNPVRAYNAERTLCDILKATSKTEIQIVTDAFKHYTRTDKKDIPLLSKYAKLFNVDKKLRSYLEVLL